MVNIVPNWTSIKGQVKDIHPHPTNAAYSMIRIAVASQKKVKDFTSLFEDLPGNDIECMVLTTAIQEAKVQKGVTVSCNISKNPPVNFINPESIKVL